MADPKSTPRRAPTLQQVDDVIVPGLHLNAPVESILRAFAWFGRLGWGQGDCLRFVVYLHLQGLLTDQGVWLVCAGELGTLIHQERADQAQGRSAGKESS